MGSSHYPSVVAVNGLGQQHRLFEASDWDEAVAKRDRLRQELAEMDVDAWCQCYSVPKDFVTGPRETT